MHSGARSAASEVLSLRDHRSRLAPVGASGSFEASPRASSTDPPTSSRGDRDSDASKIEHFSSTARRGPRCRALSPRALSTCFSSSARCPVNTGGTAAEGAEPMFSAPSGETSVRDMIVARRPPLGRGGSRRARNVEKCDRRCRRTRPEETEEALRAREGVPSTRTRDRGDLLRQSGSSFLSEKVNTAHVQMYMPVFVTLSAMAKWCVLIDLCRSPYSFAETAIHSSAGPVNTLSCDSAYQSSMEWIEKDYTVR